MPTARQMARSKQGFFRADSIGTLPAALQLRLLGSIEGMPAAGKLRLHLGGGHQDRWPAPVAVDHFAQSLRLVLEPVALGPAERLVIVLERHPAARQLARGQTQSDTTLDAHGLRSASEVVPRGGMKTASSCSDQLAAQPSVNMHIHAQFKRHRCFRLVMSGAAGPWTAG